MTQSGLITKIFANFVNKFFKINLSPYSNVSVLNNRLFYEVNVGCTIDRSVQLSYQCRGLNAVRHCAPPLWICHALRSTLRSAPPAGLQLARLPPAPPQPARPPAHPPSRLQARRCPGRQCPPGAPPPHDAPAHNQCILYKLKRSRTFSYSLI